VQQQWTAPMNTHVYRGPSAFPTCLPQRGSMRMVFGTFASHSRSPLHLVASLLNGSRSWAPERSHANFAFYACLQQKSRKDTASILPVRSLSHLVPRVRNRSRVEVDPGHDAQIRRRKSEGANQKVQVGRHMHSSCTTLVFVEIQSVPRYRTHL
jgi:hypothetical protein